MNNIQFPETFVNLILSLQHIFTKPSFEHFKVLLSAILLGHPKKTVTSGLRLMKPKGHFSNACRFMSHYKWNAIQLGLSVLLLILKYLPIDAPLTFSLDDTLVAKYGDKIFGRSCHFDHCRKVNQPQYINGHNWVIVGLLHFSSLFSKWLCLPILTELFIAEKDVPHGQLFQSRIQLAITMMNNIKQFINKQLILIADGLYAKTDLVKFCIQEKITFISRLRSDAALYQKPRTSKFPRRGRPRKYGKRLPKLTQMATFKNDFKKYYLNLYGQNRQLLIKSFEAMWKPAGSVIKVLMVYFDQSNTVSYFFCTDLSLSDTRIIELVAARWSIETLFSDLKEHLGMTDWQCRVEKSVVRSVPLTCVATSLLIIWSYQQAQLNQQPELWDIYPWYTNKASPSIYDMLQQIKAKCISKTILDSLPVEVITDEKSQQIELFLRYAA